MIHLTRLPVPEAHEPLRITARQELTVGTDTDVDGRAGVVVAPVRLLAVLPELVVGAVDDNLIVRRLEGDVFSARVRRRARHRVHVGLGDVLDGDGDVVIPGAEGLVV